MITVDSKEAIAHPQVYAALLRDVGHDNVSLAPLVFGDYIFTAPYIEALDREPTVSIELSTVSDVCGKLDSGRLAYQLSGAIQQYDVPILLIESPIGCTREGYVYLPGSPAQIRFSRLMDALFAAQSHGVIIQYCGGRDDVPAAIMRIYKYWSKPYEEHKSFRPQTLRQGITIPIGEAIDSRISALMSLPEIGEEKARKALETYGSLRTIYSLPEAALKLIPGWGPGTARKVTTFLDTELNKPVTESAEAQ